MLNYKTQSRGLMSSHQTTLPQTRVKTTRSLPFWCVHTVSGRSMQIRKINAWKFHYNSTRTKSPTRPLSLSYNPLGHSLVPLSPSPRRDVFYGYYLVVVVVAVVGVLTISPRRRRQRARQGVTARIIQCFRVGFVYKIAGRGVANCRKNCQTKWRQLKFQYILRIH